jgi:hypothetical protein
MASLEGGMWHVDVEYNDVNMMSWKVMWKGSLAVELAYKWFNQFMTHGILTTHGKLPCGSFPLGNVD